MRGLLLSTLCASALLAGTEIAPARAAVSADINIHVGRRAPAVYFARAPRVVLIPDTEIYCVQDLGYDYDMYQCGDWWYIDDGGYWYRSRSYRGPFVSISFTSLPGDFRYVPTSYRRQPYRPGQWSWSDNRNGYRGSNGWQYQNRRDRNNGDYQYVHRDQNRDWNRNDANWRNGYRRWRNDRDQNWRDDDQNGRDGRSHGDGNGRGRGHGRGHGNGNGRGHDDNDD